MNLLTFGLSNFTAQRAATLWMVLILYTEQKPNVKEEGVDKSFNPFCPSGHLPLTKGEKERGFNKYKQKHPKFFIVCWLFDYY